MRDLIWWRAMDPSNKELVARLFVVATELIEDGHMLAVQGQSHKASLTTYRASAASLKALARRLEGIAEAVSVLLEMGRAD